MSYPARAEGLGKNTPAVVGITTTTDNDISTNDVGTISKFYPGYKYITCFLKNWHMNLPGLFNAKTINIYIYQPLR